jgi:hypothetical protein
MIGSVINNSNAQKVVAAIGVGLASCGGVGLLHGGRLRKSTKSRKIRKSKSTKSKSTKSKRKGKKIGF